MVGTASLFSQLLRHQLLRHIPRTEFVSLVKKHRAERHAKGFTCWNQLVSMLFCHLARADSLREICGGLSCCLGKLVHLGIGKAPNRSTLSYANEHRPAALYEDLFWSALERFRKQGGGANAGSASRTSSCRWIRRPSPFASAFSRGPTSAAPRAGSRSM